MFTISVIKRIRWLPIEKYAHIFIFEQRKC